MESIKIYEDSLETLKNIRKQLTFDTILIDMKDLDSKSKEKLTTALAQTVSDRIRDVQKVITNSQELN